MAMALEKAFQTLSLYNQFLVSNKEAKDIIEAMDIILENVKEKNPNLNIPLDWLINSLERRSEAAECCCETCCVPKCAHKNGECIDYLIGPVAKQLNLFYKGKD